MSCLSTDAWHLQQPGSVHTLHHKWLLPPGTLSFSDVPPLPHSRPPTPNVYFYLTEEASSFRYQHIHLLVFDANGMPHQLPCLVCSRHLG